MNIITWGFFLQINQVAESTLIADSGLGNLFILGCFIHRFEKHTHIR
jgi:hypothetical protein